MKAWFIAATLLLGFALGLSLYVESRQSHPGRSSALLKAAEQNLAATGELTTLELKVGSGGLRSPAYTIRVAGNGATSFVGNKWCVFKGTTEFVIAQPAISAISQALRASQWWQVRGEFDDSSSETSWVTLRATLGSVENEVTYRWGGNLEPAEVKAARHVIQVVLDQTETRPLISPRLVIR